MASRKRDSKIEYRRRIERGLAKGFSRAQARGHRKPREKKSAKRGAEMALVDAKLQMGLRFLRKEKNFAKAAKQAHISPERLRTYAVEKGIVRKRGNRWIIKEKLARRVLIYSAGQERQIVVGNFKAASLIGKYMSAVGAFLHTNDKSYLDSFIKKSVKDTDGKFHLLETRPNVLYRLDAAGGSRFEQIYRIVI
jgi:hypothetical protein